jgi:hypothetical protein
VLGAVHLMGTCSIQPWSRISLSERQYLNDRILSWSMIASNARRRLETLGFWQRHGVEATLEAAKVSLRLEDALNDSDVLELLSISSLVTSRDRTC